LTMYYLLHHLFSFQSFSIFFFPSRRRHTRSLRDWSSDVCSSDLTASDSSVIPSPALCRNPRLRSNVSLWLTGKIHAAAATRPLRSEERRVGKECRCAM